MAKKRKAANAAPQNAAPQDAARQNAVPKRIAGMKVPKALRRGKVGRLLASPVGQALIVGAVAQAGETLIGREARAGSAGREPGGQAQTQSQTAAVASFGEGGGESRAAFVYALRQAARAFVTAMHEQQVAARPEAGRGHEPELAGRIEESLAKKDQGERPDRRTAH